MVTATHREEEIFPGVGRVVRLEEVPSGENDRFEVGVAFDLDALAFARRVCAGGDHALERAVETQLATACAQEPLQRLLQRPVQLELGGT